MHCAAFFLIRQSRRSLHASLHLCLPYLCHDAWGACRGVCVCVVTKNAVQLLTRNNKIKSFLVPEISRRLARTRAPTTQQQLRIENILFSFSRTTVLLTQVHVTRPRAGGCALQQESWDQDSGELQRDSHDAIALSPALVACIRITVRRRLTWRANTNVSV